MLGSPYPCSTRETFSYTPSDRPGDGRLCLLGRRTEKREEGRRRERRDEDRVSVLDDRLTLSTSLPPPPLLRGEVRSVGEDERLLNLGVRRGKKRGSES